MEVAVVAGDALCRLACLAAEAVIVRVTLRAAAAVGIEVRRRTDIVSLPIC